MRTLLVTRHPGAIQWIHDKGINISHHLDHLDTGDIRKGDVVIGVLPIHLAAEVCNRGGEYLHICMEVPPAERGKELSSQKMAQLHASLKRFEITSAATRSL